MAREVFANIRAYCSCKVGPSEDLEKRRNISIIPADMSWSIVTKQYDIFLGGFSKPELAHNCVMNWSIVQWNLIITVTFGPRLAGCYTKVAFLLSGIQNYHN